MVLNQKTKQPPVTYGEMKERQSNSTFGIRAQPIAEISGQGLLGRANSISNQRSQPDTLFNLHASHDLKNVPVV